MRRTLCFAIAFGIVIAGGTGCSSAPSSTQSASADAQPADAPSAAADAESTDAPGATDTPEPPRRCASRAILQTDLSRAAALVDEAASIVSQTPTTQMEASALTGNFGRPFYDHDRAFQDEVSHYKISPECAAPETVADLASVETFSYHAVADTLATCNGADGRGNLRVARAFLQEAQRDFAGTAKDSWEPPEYDDNGSSDCQN